MLRALVRIVLFFLPSAVFADAAPPGVPDAGTGLVQVILGLAVVVVLLFAGLHVLKRVSGPRGGAAGVLKVLAAAAVGPRERVVLIEVGETWLVVGVAPGNVSALHTLQRRELPVAPAGNVASVKDFGAWLRHAMERKDGR